FPETQGLLVSIDRVTRKDDNVYLDALGLAETLFDDHMAANLLVLGAAYQAGAIPVSAAAIEEAIVLNGVSVQMNTQAFRAGRMLVVDPRWAAGLRKHRIGAVESTVALTAEARAIVEKSGATGELCRLIEIRVPELIAYQDAGYAREYVDFVKRVAAAEQAAVPGETRLAEAMARYLFKLMAYKDEYEVARLHLKTDLAAQLADEYPGGVEVHYQLHPPLLRALGFQNKLKLGKRWFDTAFRALVAMRRLRGTALDPFGTPKVRRVERELIGEYRTLIEHAPLAVSSPDHHRCTASATPAVDGDLVVARQVVGLQTLEGGAAHLDEAPSGHHLGRRASKVRVIGGERFGQAGFERIPGLEIERIRKAPDQSPDLGLVVVHRALGSLQLGAAARAFQGSALLLALDPALPGRRRGPGGPTDPRLAQRGREQATHLLACDLEIAGLVAGFLARDDQAAVGVEAIDGERVQARPRAVTQPLDGVEIDAQVDLRGDLVDVLAAGTRRSNGAHGQRASRHAHGFGHHDRLAHDTHSIIDGV